ncbi:hypothetical protein H5410_038129 [Solanum commersonii]|uniref:Uncharacterized protein n=1 Tax=Solanum commersonii TaxID=4109 RepID=A0A9J5Y976_SOLCO|nr:hypothetical protein H5410_038129 [Solanum commersonii]
MFVIQKALLFVEKVLPILPSGSPIYTTIKVLAVYVAACNKLLVWVFWCFPSSPSSSGIFKSSDGLNSACLASCC